MPQSITRQQIIDAAKSLLDCKYLHQGRNPATGIDCAGFVVLVAEKIGYQVEDIEGYKRNPVNSELLDLLNRNLEEIDLADIQPGDIYAMKLGGAKIRHLAIKVSDTTLIHALNSGATKKVIEQPVSLYKTEFVKAFQFKGVV